MESCFSSKRDSSRPVRDLRGMASKTGADLVGVWVVALARDESFFVEVELLSGSSASALRVFGRFGGGFCVVAAFSEALRLDEDLLVEEVPFIVEGASM